MDQREQNYQSNTKSRNTLHPNRGSSINSSTHKLPHVGSKLIAKITQAPVDLEILTKYGVLKKGIPKVVASETEERPNSVETSKLIRSKARMMIDSKGRIMRQSKESFRNYLSSLGYLPG